MSRAAAERHLRDILTAGDSTAVPTASLGWSVTEVEPATPDAESHLEQRFRQLFTDRLADLGATLRETPGTWGNTVSIGFPHATRQWTPEDWLHTPAVLDRVRDSWRDLAQLNSCLADNVGATTKEPRR